MDCANNNVLTNTEMKNIAFCAEITQNAMFFFLINYENESENILFEKMSNTVKF